MKTIEMKGAPSATLETRKAATALGRKGSIALRAMLAKSGEAPSPWSEDTTGDPVLVEGTLYGSTIEVESPEGTRIFRMNAWAVSTRVILHIHPAASRFATVFRHVPEIAHVHPFVGRAEEITTVAKGGEA